MTWVLRFLLNKIKIKTLNFLIFWPSQHQVWSSVIDGGAYLRLVKWTDGWMDRHRYTNTKTTMTLSNQYSFVKELLICVFLIFPSMAFFFSDTFLESKLCKVRHVPWNYKIEAILNKLFAQQWGPITTPSHSTLTKYWLDNLFLHIWYISFKSHLLEIN